MKTAVDPIEPAEEDEEAVVIGRMTVPSTTSVAISDGIMATAT